MPKFIVTQRSFINNKLLETGTEVEYDPGAGEVADNLQPVKSSPKTAAETGAGKED